VVAEQQAGGELRVRVAGEASGDGVVWR
jgi:hypothetical protein